jgi:hypothetical protein
MLDGVLQSIFSFAAGALLAAFRSLLCVSLEKSQKHHPIAYPKPPAPYPRHCSRSSDNFERQHANVCSPAVSSHDCVFDGLTCKRLAESSGARSDRFPCESRSTRFLVEMTDYQALLFGQRTIIVRDCTDGFSRRRMTANPLGVQTQARRLRQCASRRTLPAG